MRYSFPEWPVLAATYVNALHFRYRLAVEAERLYEVKQATPPGVSEPAITAEKPRSLGSLRGGSAGNMMFRNATSSH
jgi:hypothetical protein